VEQGEKSERVGKEAGMTRVDTEKKIANEYVRLTGGFVESQAGNTAITEGESREGGGNRDTGK